MARGEDKLLLQVAIQDLSVAELIIMFVACQEGDETTFSQILARLSETNLGGFLEAGAGLNDRRTIAKAIWGAAGDRSAYELYEDPCLSDAIFQGRA